MLSHICKRTRNSRLCSVQWLGLFFLILFLVLPWAVLGQVAVQGGAGEGVSCSTNDDCAGDLVCQQKECPEDAPCPGERTCQTFIPAILPTFKPVEPKLQIPIPGLPQFSKIILKGKKPGEYYLDVPWIAEYIAGLYKYFVGIASIVATIMIMIGGVQWLTAGGSPDKIGKARTRISNAVVGLILALGSYLVLYVINPELVSFESWRKAVSITYIEYKPLPDSEDTAPCHKISIDIEQYPVLDPIPTDLVFLKTSGGWVAMGMRKEANSALQSWAQKFHSQTAKPLIVNRAFASSEYQTCLYEKLGPKIVNKPGTSTHEMGRGVDVSTAGLTNDEYKLLLKTAKEKNFKVGAKELQSYQETGADLPANWRDIPERWHFTHQSSGGIVKEKGPPPPPSPPSARSPVRD